MKTNLIDDDRAIATRKKRHLSVTDVLLAGWRVDEVRLYKDQSKLLVTIVNSRTGESRSIIRTEAQVIARIFSGFKTL